MEHAATLIDILGLLCWVGWLAYRAGVADGRRAAGNPRDGRK